MEEEQKQTTTSLSKSGTKETENDQEYFKVVKPLRTYERDIAESLRNKDASQASIHLEERRSEEKKKPKAKIKKPFPFKKLLTVGIVLVMLAAGGLMIYWLLPIINSPAPQIAAPQIDSLVRSDSIKTFDVEGKSREEILSFVRETFQNSLPAENPRLVQIQFTNADSLSKTQGIRSEILFDLLAPEAPAVLKRALGYKASYGFLAESSSTTSPFLITELESFENAFASMLSWEKTIEKDFSRLISDLSEVPTERNFEDIVIRNKDVRILKSAEGESSILYSFLDKNTLLIAQNERIFREILDRFLVKQLSD